MPSLSDYAESGILTHFFRTATFTKPEALAIALATGDILQSFGGTLGQREVGSSGGYARVYSNPSDTNWAPITQDASSSGTTSNSTVIQFPTAAGANWGRVTFVAICTTGTYGGGSLLMYGPLQTDKVIQIGDTFSFAANQLQIYLD